MPSLREKIAANAARIREQVAAAAARAGRDPNDIVVLPVTKSVGLDEVRILAELGFARLGENRVDHARDKIVAMGDAVRWHMIGKVQRRKAKDVVELFDRVDSVDRMSLAEELEKRCAAMGKTMDVLVEVNVSGETAKDGFAPEEVSGAIEAIDSMEHLQVRGLMTMAPIEVSPEDTRLVFRELAGLARAQGLDVLSMGMTNDFEVAIEEGSTEVRIGRAFFN